MKVIFSEYAKLELEDAIPVIPTGIAGICRYLDGENSGGGEQLHLHELETAFNRDNTNTEVDSPTTASGRSLRYRSGCYPKEKYNGKNRTTSIPTNTCSKN